jgi:biotin carboxyl carrier protein
VIFCKFYYFENNLQVSEGQEMAVMEAMKMQNSLAAGKTGKVYKSVFIVLTRTSFIRLGKSGSL